MKYLLVLILTVLTAACSSQKIKPKKIKSPKFEILQVLNKQNSDSIYDHVLKFNRVPTAFATEIIMFNKFGMWDKEVRPNHELHPVLIWKNRKLSKAVNEYFTIAASGLEYKRGMYALVSVFDAKGRDCLSKTSNKRNLIIDFFAHNIRHLNRKSDFYKVYWKMINNYKTKYLDKNE